MDYACFAFYIVEVYQRLFAYGGRTRCELGALFCGNEVIVCFMSRGCIWILVVVVVIVAGLCGFYFGG